MKLVLCMLFASTCLATTFITSENFNFETRSNFVIEQEVKVDIISHERDFNNGTSVATIAVNNNEIEVKTKFERSGLSDYDQFQSIFSAKLFTKTLTAGMPCLDEETVTYKVEFKETTTRDPDDLASLEAISLKAERYYTWDVCHDFNPITETIDYIIK